MTSAFLDGVLAGYGIAIPVGAIALLIVETGLQRGFGIAFMAGAGAAGADLIYATIAAAAGTALAVALTPVARPLRIASAIVLILLGGQGLFRLRQSPARTSPAPPASGSAHLRTFLQFLGLTLLNPFTVAYFAALILGMNSGAAATLAARLVFVAGAVLASLSWQSLLAAIGALGKRHLSPRFRLITSMVGNVIIVGMGARILATLVLA